MSFVLLLVCGALVGGCASHEPPQLVGDPSAKKNESSLPWNEQTDWERAGPYGEMLKQKQNSR
jgi:hypothetical protein